MLELSGIELLVGRIFMAVTVTLLIIGIGAIIYAWWSIHHED